MKFICKICIWVYSSNCVCGGGMRAQKEASYDFIYIDKRNKKIRCKMSV